MENRIKECQLDLYADRTSAATMRANQLRLWFACLAYVLVCALRRIGLPETVFAETRAAVARHHAASPQGPLRTKYSLPEQHSKPRSENDASCVADLARAAPSTATAPRCAPLK